jgi:1-acyl-sn-glycerol-3-phosphate acyltransferase
MTDKLINSVCKYCDIPLSWYTNKIICLLPCNHLVHKSCFIKTIKTNSPNIGKCPICDIQINNFMEEEDLKRKRKYTQQYIDILSLTNFDNLTNYDKTIFQKNILSILELFISTPFMKGFDGGHQLCKHVLNLCNMELEVFGMENINPLHKRRIYIANHTTHFDYFVMFYLFKCGFLSSSFILKSAIGRHITTLIPLVIFNRSKDKQTVKKIKQYVEKNGSIAIFPEGLITHPDTIIRFRTGAFYADQIITPVVMKFDPPIYDCSIGDFIIKLASGSISVKVYVLPEEHPPFTPERIEEVRDKMARAGNLAKSRVINRDIKDD